jgi:hypothetical protein
MKRLPGTCVRDSNLLRATTINIDSFTILCNILSGNSEMLRFLGSELDDEGAII